ncbi:MAG TPA: hypothetical protein VKT78_16990, partial [Fimbriimonadaceae bacterium]|nr:hypothetical protein [Fimbriimonadaceae bacterium]
IDGDCLVVRILADHALPAKPAVVAEVRRLQQPRVYHLAGGDGPLKVRASGKRGCEVVVTRVWGDRVEEISHDSYPVMDRVVGS